MCKTCIDQISRKFDSPEESFAWVDEHVSAWEEEVGMEELERMGEVETIKASLAYLRRFVSEDELDDAALLFLVRLTAADRLGDTDEVLQMLGVRPLVVVIPRREPELPIDPDPPILH
jgi:hypothetical protein